MDENDDLEVFNEPSTGLIAVEGEIILEKDDQSVQIVHYRKAMDRFLDRLRTSGNVMASCRAAGVNRRTIYTWRDKFPIFADEWQEALDDAVDMLELEAWKRATKGRSDGMLMFLLKAHRRWLYGDRTEVRGEFDSNTEIVVKVIGGVDLGKDI